MGLAPAGGHDTPMLAGENVLTSELHAQITPNDPFLALEHLSTFMKHTISTMAMQQCKTHIKVNDKRFRRCIFAFLLG
jgi:hypothetical protein